MALAPLGTRVLIRPHEAPDTSDGGIILPEDRDHVPVSGRIVALGPGGSKMRLRARERAIAHCLEALTALGVDGDVITVGRAKAAIQPLAAMACPEREIAVGDEVCFPAEVGMNVTHDGEAFVLVHEDDLAVLETA